MDLSQKAGGVNLRPVALPQIQLLPNQRLNEIRK